jgi:hypothetical protein
MMMFDAGAAYDRIAVRFNLTRNQVAGYLNRRGKRRGDAPALPAPEFTVWPGPQRYQLALPAPQRPLLLPPPREIRVGSFVKFSKEFFVRQGWNHSHWAHRYGNGVGRVRAVHSEYKTAQIDFPHRMECHSLKYIESAYCTCRTQPLRSGG